MRSTMYRQCLLRKPEGVATLEQVCWLPVRFAVVGKTLRLKEDGWQGGWRVSEAWPTLRHEDYLPDSHNDIKQHRRRTGDAMTKV
jgi:hypothetical protein